MDAGEDIIDVLYRIRDRSSSPRQKSLPGSRYTKEKDNLHTSQPHSRSLNYQSEVIKINHTDIQRQRFLTQHISAPLPPRNYDIDLYHLNRQGVAYERNSHMTGSVFHRQTFVPSNQRALYDQARARNHSGGPQEKSTSNLSYSRHQDTRYRPHKSEDNLDIDLATPRSVKVDVIPREDIVSKGGEEGLLLMPNGTRQRQTREKDLRQVKLPKKTLLMLLCAV